MGRKEELEEKIWALPPDDAHRNELIELENEYRDIIGKEQEIKKQVKQDISREMKQRRGRGKYGERRLAKKVGGVVVGRSKAVVTSKGKVIKINCMKPPDVVTDIFSFESKWLEKLSVELETDMGQAISNAPEGLTPVLVWGNRKTGVCYYVMTEHDWLDWLGGR